MNAQTHFRNTAIALALGALLASGSDVVAQTRTSAQARDLMNVPVSSDTASARHQQARFAGAAGGTLGSMVGITGGAMLGAVAASGCTGFLCGMGELMLGATVGSMVGSALGAKLGVRWSGREPSGAGLGALLGTLSGVGAAVLLAQVDEDGVAPLVGFSVAQGIVTGLFAAR